jgi:transcriptional regulator with XRE-family HTH domain
MQAKRITFLSEPYDGGMNTGRPASQPRTPFGERLHAAREARGLAQAQVAEQLGMSQNAYACWERKAVALRPDQIEKLSEILGVSVDALFNGNGGTDRKGGPTGKARRVFDEVSRLPRKRQQRIVSVVEDMLAAQRMAVNA